LTVAGVCGAVLTQGDGHLTIMVRTLNNEVELVVSTGAESDLDHASQIARQMVGRWGGRNGFAPARPVSR